MGLWVYRMNHSMSMTDVFSTNMIKTDEHDTLVRFRTNSLVSMPTQDFVDSCRSIFQQDISLLSRVIVWQRRTIEYNALYTAFLLDAMTEEEFEEESDKFLVRKQHVDVSQIKSEISRIETLTGLEFDTSDYPGFFSCSQENVMQGMALLKDHERFLSVLPERLR